MRPIDFDDDDDDLEPGAQAIAVEDDIDEDDGVCAEGSPDDQSPLRRAIRAMLEFTPSDVEITYVQAMRYLSEYYTTDSPLTRMTMCSGSDVLVKAFEEFAKELEARYDLSIKYHFLASCEADEKA